MLLLSNWAVSSNALKTVAAPIFVPSICSINSEGANETRETPNATLKSFARNGLSPTQSTIFHSDCLIGINTLEGKIQMCQCRVSFFLQGRSELFRSCLIGITDIKNLSFLFENFSVILYHSDYYLKSECFTY